MTDFSLGSDPDSGVGFPESDSGSGSSQKRHRRVGSYDPLVENTEYAPLIQNSFQRNYWSQEQRGESEDRQLLDSMGKPLKGILKNNQFQSLPRPGTGGCGCQSLLEYIPGPENICDTSERRRSDEVIDTVESSV